MAQADLGLGPEQAGLADDGQDAGPSPAFRLGAGVRLEELLRVELAGDEDQAAAVLADEVA